MMAVAPALTLHKVERRYKQGETTLHILRGAELMLWPGQSVALVAPSGAGKSTLLHVAGLLEKPDAGEVLIGSAPTAVMGDQARTALRRTAIGFRLPVPSPAAGVFGSRKRHPAADDRRARP